MYTIRVAFKQKDIKLLQRLRDFSTIQERPKIKLNKCLIFSKFSRYDYERVILSQFTDFEVERILRNKGVNYDKLMCHKKQTRQFEQKLTRILENMGIETKTVNRLTCTRDDLNWADVIMPSGGDGTFLLAASKIRGTSKPVIGINSDPKHSEGYLCLPKKYSENIEAAVKNLQEGNFKWLLRNRIRTTLISKKIEQPVMDLHQIRDENLYSIEEISDRSTLPVLALNEIVVGEKLFARASHLDLSLDGSIEFTKIKSSGICIATGTGSTSWYYSMNRLPVHCVRELLELLNYNNTQLDELAKELSEAYNKRLPFPPDDYRLAYTIRDMIVAGVWPSPKGLEPRGFAKSVRLKSHCYDAGLIVDGNVSFPFNDGAEAVFEIHPEDSLRTVVME